MVLVAMLTVLPLEKLVLIVMGMRDNNKGTLYESCAFPILKKLASIGCS